MDWRPDARGDLRRSARGVHGWPRGASPACGRHAAGAFCRGASARGREREEEGGGRLGRAAAEAAAGARAGVARAASGRGPNLRRRPVKAKTDFSNFQISIQMNFKLQTTF
jgi:hypothetical protein